MLHQLCHDAVQCTHYKGTVTHAPCHGPSYALPPSLVPGRTFSSNFPTSVSYKPQRQAQPVTRIVHDSTFSTRLRAQRIRVNGGRHSLPLTFHPLEAEPICIAKIVVRSASTFMEQLTSMKRRQIGDVINFLVA